jgi:hypothetical protein
MIPEPGNIQQGLADTLVEVIGGHEAFRRRAGLPQALCESPVDTRRRDRKPKEGGGESETNA